MDELQDATGSIGVVMMNNGVKALHIDVVSLFYEALFRSKSGIGLAT